jgi:tRNA dimethylallyltransferase
MSRLRAVTTSDSPSKGIVIAVVGPTAVGKTALAEEIAVRKAGEIVSADSMQVYRGMDIGTAKPDIAELRVPYHCLDLVDPGVPFSAALFQVQAREAIERIFASGGLPILSGGTGLYVRAALDKFEFPVGEQQDNPLRARFESMAATQGPEAVYALLRELDPASAALIHPHNTRRVVRALEMHEAGVSYAQHSSGFTERVSVYDVRMLGLTMDRARLYERIDQRVESMMARGLMEEVEGLLAYGFREALTSTQAIGYKELVAVIEGRSTLDDAIDAIKQASRRYAKRQLTWFNADSRIRWLDVTDLSLEESTTRAFAALDW